MEINSKIVSILRKKKQPKSKSKKVPNEISTTYFQCTENNVKILKYERDF